MVYSCASASMGIPFLEPPWITKSIGHAACCPPECYKSVRIGKVIAFSLQKTLEGHLMVGGASSFACRRPSGQFNHDGLNLACAHVYTLNKQ